MRIAAKDGALVSSQIRSRPCLDLYKEALTRGCADCNINTNSSDIRLDGDLTLTEGRVTARLVDLFNLLKLAGATLCNGTTTTPRDRASRSIVTV